MISSASLIRFKGLYSWFLYKFTKKEMLDKHIIYHLPCYNETHASMKKTIDNLVCDNYNNDKKLLFLVIDGSDSTFKIVEELLKLNLGDTKSGIYKAVNNKIIKADVYYGYYYLERGEFTRYIVINKFVNSGKRDSQIILYKFLSYYYENHKLKNTSNIHGEHIIHLDNDIVDDSEDLYPSIYDSFLELHIDPYDYYYILAIDSDTFVKKDAVSLLVNSMERKTKSIGTCGETRVENRMDSWITIPQVFEYFITHYMLKGFENFYGQVLVLSGCFSLYRIKDSESKNFYIINPQIIRTYAQSTPKNLHEANLLEIGEDRYLTSLLLRNFPNMSTDYIEQAKCWTNVPDRFTTLLCQRRRWTNSLIHCHISLLLNLPKYGFFKKIFFIFVIVLELWIVFFLPIIMLISLFYVTYSLIIKGYSLIPLISSIAVIVLPIIVCFLLLNLQYVIWSIPFILTQPIFSVLIPWYSLWKSDMTSWGQTRT